MKTGAVIAIVGGIVAVGVAGFFVIRAINRKEDEKESGLIVTGDADTDELVGMTTSDSLTPGAGQKKRVVKKTVKQWLEEKYGKGNWRPQWKKMKRACKNESSPRRKWRRHLADYISKHVPSDVNPLAVPDTNEDF